MRSAYPNLQIVDLSEQWFEQTGKTFVHAIVAVRNGIELDQEFLAAVQEAKTEGLSRIESIAQTESEKMGIAFETCLDYLSTKIIYDLGEGRNDRPPAFPRRLFCKRHPRPKESIQFVEV